jgi:hypothetical protein
MLGHAALKEPSDKKCTVRPGAARLSIASVGSSWPCFLAGRSMGNKLFAVYLGGRAPKCKTELHDVVFALGETIGDTYEQLLDQWFGSPHGQHLDSWIEPNIVAGHKVTLADDKPANGKRLYFINLGGYADGQFTELHANTFVVAKSEQEAKAKGKDALSKALPGPVHTDDLHDIDDCLEISEVGTCHVALEVTEERETLKPTNGYHIIPEPIIADMCAAKRVCKTRDAYSDIENAGR